MLNLTKEQIVLFALLRGEKLSDTSSANWNEVMREAQSQAVFLMLKQPENLSTDVSSKWQKQYYTMMKSNIRAFFAVSEMNRIMREINQPYVILKGVASASYYSDVFDRSLGDVDFLIDSEKQNGVMNALQKAGYKAQTPTKHHIAFLKEKQDLEMHFEIPGVPLGELGNIVREYISDIFAETISYRVNNTVVELPQPKFHGLIILLHMLGHMTSEGLGLRHLIDWCYFVEKTENDEFWNKELLPLFKKIGVFKYAQVMTKVGELYLHTVCPAWCVDVDEELCDSVMLDIINNGNFGRKNRTRSASSLMMPENRNNIGKSNKIYNLWQSMLVGIVGYHPIVKKCPILYPVFIIDFLFRRFKHVIKGERQPLWKSAKYVNERESVYEQLHLFEV